MRASLASYMEQVQQLADNGQMERHEEEVAKLGERLRELPNDLPEDQLLAELELIAGALKGMTANAGTAAAEIRTKLETEFQGTAESISAQAEAATRKADTMAAQFETSISRISRAATIENFAKMAGGIASVGTAIQQLQNFGSIWKNEDLTTGQKLLQTITNLAISLPMLATGFTKATTALGLMKTMTTAEAVAAGISTSAEAAHAVSIGLVETASGAAAIKVQLLNTTLMLNPFVAVAAGVIALVTAIGSLIKAADEANKKLIESKQAEIDAENKKQEEIENNKQLLTSLEDLNKKYEDGEITRSDLKSTIQDLIDQYGLEGKAADDLAHSYDNLADYIKQAREEAAQEAKESADRELAAAQDEVTATAKGSAFDAGSQSGSNYLLNIGAGSAGAHGLFADEPKQIEQLLKDAGALQGLSGDGADFTFLTDFDTEHIVELYNTIQGIVDQVNDLREAGKLTDQQLQNSEYYQNMLSWLDQMKDSVEHYKDALKDVSKYSTELTAITAEGTGKVDFSDIQNANQYLEQRLALIQ